MNKKSPELKSLEKLAYISVGDIVPTFKMAKFFGSAFAILQKEIGECNEDNKFFAHYNNVDWEGCQKKGFISFIRMMFMKWDVEACISVDKKGDYSEKVVYSEIKEPKDTLQCIHYGPYHKVSETYLEIANKAEEKRLKLSNESFEFYLNDPKDVPKEDLQTLIVVPVGK
jgi:effector-binding domain-containing protein